MNLVILKNEYLKLIQSYSNLIAELPKQVSYCAAKLIQYLQNWSKWKQAVHRTSWIYLPLKKIYEDLMGEHSLHVIRSAITVLEKLKLIEKRHNPNWQDKTWQYRLKLDVLKSLLDSVRGEFNAEHREFNVEQHTNNQSIEIRSTNDVGVKEKTEVTEEKELTPEVIEIQPITQITKPSSTPPAIQAQPTEAELTEVAQQLRELRVNAAECKGVIKKYWANVQGAIALLKNFKGANKPIAVFISACQKGLKPEIQEETIRPSAIPDEIRPPAEKQFVALDTAKHRKQIKDYFFSGDGITKVVLFNGLQLPWWEFLEDIQCQS